MTRIASAGLFLVALSALAQTAVPVPSPFAIRREILRRSETYNFAALVRRLKLPSKFEFEGKAAGFGRIALHAEVHPFSYGIYFLELCYDVNRYCRLVAFEGDSLAKPGESWKIRGYIDDFNWRGLNFEKAERWLVLTRHVGSGAGVSEYDRSWFELTESGFQERLRHTSHGHLAFAGEPWSKWNTNLLFESNVQNAASMTFLYYVRFELEGPGSTALDARRLVTFTRPNGSTTYQFDSGRSELTAKEIALFFTASGRPTAAPIRAFSQKASK